MADPDRNKRDAPTVKSMKSAKGAKRPTEPGTSKRAKSEPPPAAKSGPRARKTGRRGGLVEEVGERVRRDPRREND